MLVISTSARRGFLGQLVPWLNTFKLRLFVNDIVPDPHAGVSQFVDPSYSGYAPIALTQFPQPYLNANDQGETVHPTVTFVVGPGGGSESAYGYWITDQADTFLLAERFELGPVDLTLPGAMCPLAVRLLSGNLC